jgi:hypothetical protein
MLVLPALVSKFHKDGLYKTPSIQAMAHEAKPATIEMFRKIASPKVEQTQTLAATLCGAS